MGTKSRVLVGAISITIVVVATACSDGTTAPAPEAYVTTGVARVMNPASGQLEVVNPPLSEGVNADVVVGSSAQSALLVADNAPGVAPTASHADYSYVDSQGRANKVVFLWHTSGPVTAAYHFVNGTLVAYT